MTAEDFARLVESALYSDDAAYEQLASSSSYEEAGVLTSNTGLVVRMQDGSEFQVTVVQSR